jgi:hypothetical protein
MLLHMSVGKASSSSGHRPGTMLHWILLLPPGPCPRRRPCTMLRRILLFPPGTCPRRRVGGGGSAREWESAEEIASLQWILLCSDRCVLVIRLRRLRGVTEALLTSALDSSFRTGNRRQSGGPMCVPCPLGSYKGGVG